MEDASNDKTIGRTNRSSPVRAVRPVSASESGTPPPPPLTYTNANNPLSADGEAPSHPLVYTTTTTGGPFEWPTNADHYQLINRIGQGAFASVWRADIIRRTKNDDENNEGAEKNKTAEIHCAIKIMDLEHVNINISGELFYGYTFVFDVCVAIEISCNYNPWIRHILINLKSFHIFSFERHTIGSPNHEIILSSKRTSLSHILRS
jgi:hypothetical protein